MAFASVEVSRKHAHRAWNQYPAQADDEGQNYVVPNLAPRAFEVGHVQEFQAPSWRAAPAPPPDPAWVLLQWMIQRPGLALMFAYALWLGFWSVYALRALDF